MTYVLRQEENGLARAGLLHLEIRPGRSEADVALLTPALDAPQGHPAIWQKLLSQSVHELVERQINRLYSDLPDQPLVVSTFKQAGFQLYVRETIWRLAALPHDWLLPSPPPIRPCYSEDNWNLIRLYHNITPLSVQQAEGSAATNKEYSEPFSCPILVDDLGLPRSQFVLEGHNGLEGCVQLIWGRQGTWIRLWTDTNNPDTQAVHLLLRHALFEIAAAQAVNPIYISVREYQSGLESILSDYGFAPFTDRARMVRNIWQWAYRPATLRVPALESVREVIPGSLVIPKTIHDEVNESATSTPVVIPTEEAAP
jgi:hypothetical protein